MKLVVKRNRELAPINSQNSQNENKAETIELSVPEEYESFNKKIVFITPNETVWDVIVNNQYKITNAITKYDKVDYYIWLTKEVDGESIDFRTKTRPLNFYHNEDASDEITDEEIHGVNTVVNLLEEEIEKVENLNIEATKIGDTTTVTITKKDGTTESVEINDGADGQDGHTPQKGIDYFTEQDIEEIETDVKNDLEENVLLNYSLIAETGAKIELSINQTNYKLTAILKDKNNNIIHTSNVIDLPLETMVVNATYDNINKAIILTLQNGTTVSISVADLVSGLVSESQLQTILSNFYNKAEINNLLNNKVDKVQGKELSSNDFTDTLKEKLEGLENYDDTEIKADISDIQDEQTEQNTEIEKLQTENARFKATLPTTGEVTGQTITLNKTAELEFKKPPLPMGNSEQEGTTGKNLAGIIDVMGNHISKEEDKITYSSGAYASDFVNLEQKELEANQEYVFEMFLVSKSNNTNPVEILIKDSENVNFFDVFKNIGGNTTYYSQNFTPTAVRTLNKLQLYCPQSAPLTGDVVFRFQIRKANTNEGYEPYTNGASPNPDYPQPITNVTGDVEVVVGNKNILQDFYYGKIPSVATGSIVDVYGCTTDYIQVDNSKQCIWSYELTNLSISKYVLYYDKNKNYLGYKTNTNLISSESHWNKTKYIKLRMDCNIDVTSNWLVEYNSTSTSYVAHQEQTFIFPLGNEKLMLGDYLADDGIHHVRGQVVFDGSENWNYEHISAGNNFYTKIQSSKGNVYENILCNFFKHYENGSLEQKYSCMISPGKNLNLRHEDFNNANDFKSWIQTKYNNGTPLILEYELAEEIIVPYTSAQQEVYNQIKQALSYEEQTNISSNQIALFNVEAYQNTKLILQEMATAIVALGGV